MKPKTLVASYFYNDWSLLNPIFHFLECYSTGKWKSLISDSQSLSSWSSIIKINCLWMLRAQQHFQKSFWKKLTIDFYHRHVKYRLSKYWSCFYTANFCWHGSLNLYIFNELSSYKGIRLLAALMTCCFMVSFIESQLIKPQKVVGKSLMSCVTLWWFDDLPPPCRLVEMSPGWVATLMTCRFMVPFIKYQFIETHKVVEKISMSCVTLCRFHDLPPPM